MEELLKLYQIHSPIMNESKMVNYIVARLRNMGLTVKTDNIDNIYGVYGESDTYPCIVAHSDEVHFIKPKDFEIIQYKGNLFGFSESKKDFVGLGADDKNGIWIALKVAEQFVRDKQPIKVAFFVAEEADCVGSGNSDLTFFKDCRFVLQFDRKGGSDFINKANGLELNSKEFRRTAGKIYRRYGYKNARGYTTDVYKLKTMGLDISVANISCGYYNAHTEKEMTNIKELKNALKMALELMNIKDRFPHTAKLPVQNPNEENEDSFGN